MYGALILQYTPQPFRFSELCSTHDAIKVTCFFGGGRTLKDRKLDFQLRTVSSHVPVNEKELNHQHELKAQDFEASI